MALGIREGEKSLFYRSSYLRSHVCDLIDYHGFIITQAYDDEECEVCYPAGEG